MHTAKGTRLETEGYWEVAVQVNWIKPGSEGNNGKAQLQEAGLRVLRGGPSVGADKPKRKSRNPWGQAELEAPMNTWDEMFREGVISIC